MDRERARKLATELVSKMSTQEMASQLKFNAPEIDRLGIPEYNWWSEGLHGAAREGTATVFPQAIGMAAMFDETLVEKAGEVTSTEARAKYNEFSKRGDRDIYKGLTLWSPNVNIFRDPRWGRGHETFGEDPFLTGRLGTAYVKGLQGNGEHLRVAACAKHFAVHSGPESLRHSFDARPTKKDMYETYLPAFEACVKDGKVEAVMGAYNRVNGQPACASTELQDILREKWGFEGHFVSDCWAIRDFHENHRVTKDYFESAALALKNGCDVNCGCTYEYIMYAYEKGLIDEEDIRKAAINLFTTRYMLGMFEESDYDKLTCLDIETPENLALSREIAQKSIVLLKNDGVLPLKKESLKTVGVIGPNANSRVALIGNYHGTASRYVTVLDGLKDYLEPDVRILYSEGCHLWKNRAESLAKPGDRLSEAMMVCDYSDVVILCLGLDETLEGEEGDTSNSHASGDKEDLLLPESQQKLLEEVNALGKPYILCMLSGSSIDMSAASNAAAILQCWYPGAMGGHAVTDILFGKVSPSAKLPLTFYYNSDLDNMPEFTDYAMTNRTYRYFESKPLYPFGYGLTYSDVRVEKAEYTNGHVKATVKNQGSVDTEDVIQVYIKITDSPNEVRNHRLCGFKRTFIKANDSVEITIPVLDDSFYVIDESGNKVKDGYNAILYIGTGQPDERTKELTGERGVFLKI